MSHGRSPIRYGAPVVPTVATFLWLIAKMVVKGYARVLWPFGD